MNTPITSQDAQREANKARVVGTHYREHFKEENPTTPEECLDCIPSIKMTSISIEDEGITEPIEDAELLATFSLQEKTTWHKQEAFLLAYAETGSIRAASPVCGTNRVTVYYWQKRDALGFNNRFTMASHRFRERIQDHIIHRVFNPEGNRGSDVLLLALINATWPERYRQNVAMPDDVVKDTLAELKRLRKVEPKNPHDIANSTKDTGDSNE
jgi:hypothetical protein